LPEGSIETDPHAEEFVDLILIERDG